MSARKPTPDSHDFPTRRYDLVKEGVIAFAVILILALGLAAVFSSPDEKAITMKAWATAAPNDVVTTAVAELAGTSESAGYGPPYNSNSSGQFFGPIPSQRWGGVTVPINSANDLVITPLESVMGDSALTVGARGSGRPRPPTNKRRGPPPTPTRSMPRAEILRAQGAATTARFPSSAPPSLTLAKSGGLEQLLSGTFYGGNDTKALLLLSDGTYLEDQAVARSLGGDQFGMINSSGNYPGQPWLAPVSFWYQVEPFKSSDNADALIFIMMGLVVVVVIFVPFIPGLRAIPEKIPVYKLVWRTYYRRNKE